MEKRPIGYQPGRPSVLDKKVPKSDKYSHVESKLAGKIGTTAKDVEFVSNKEVSKRRGQLFRRVKPSTLSKMLHQQVESQSVYGWTQGDQAINHVETKSTSSMSQHGAMMMMMNQQQGRQAMGQSGYSHHSSQYNERPPEEDARSQTSKLTSVTIRTEQLPVGLETDFLLLDLREPDEYEEYHIKQALSFPGPFIKRDKHLPQLLTYRNHATKIIVVYHFDEKKGIEYANQFAQRGYDNVYLVNGGIEAFGAEFPDSLEGLKVPSFHKKEEVRKFKKQRLD